LLNDLALELEAAVLGRLGPAAPAVIAWLRDGRASAHRNGPLVARAIGLVVYDGMLIDIGQPIRAYLSHLPDLSAHEHLHLETFAQAVSAAVAHVTDQAA
jgi:hypothetical protein